MKVDCYLQVKPTRWSWAGADRPRRPIEGKIERCTTKKPQHPVGGTVLVKLTLDVADEAFMPLEPKVEVKIPAIHTTAIEVESEPMEVPA